MKLTINGLQHIGIPVSELKVSVAFYEKLGFTDVMTAPFELDGEQGRCTMMRRDDFVIELYQMPPSKLTEIENRKDGRIDHFAFDVPDVDEAMVVLKSEGFNVIEEAPVKLKFWKNGVRFFFITGPDGERIEFNQIL